MLNGVPRILIIRLSAIGDVVRVLPALHALRDLYPTAQIDWVVEPKAADIVRDHPCIDQVLLFERPPGKTEAARAFMRLCGVVRDNRYDIAVDFHGILKSGLLLRASGAKERYAFAPPRAQELSYLFANRRTKLVSDRLNRIEENLELCKALGAKLHMLDVELPDTVEVADDIDEFFEEQFDSAKWVVGMHVAVDRPEKQWPLENFAALADMILADGRCEVLLTWGPGQLASAEAVERMALRNPVVAPEMPTLLHYVDLIQRCALYVGGDTGPMHIASAAGTPVVALFGGTDPAKHAPLRPPSTVVYGGPDSPRKAVDREYGAQWLAAIAVEDVYDACIGLLRSLEQGGPEGD